jgi:1-acyl-sn-glycerol-3-phosphate acyltransferase
MILCLIPILPICMFFNFEAPLFEIGKWAVRLSLKFLGLRLYIGGLEHVDPSSFFVFMANHLSFIDGPLLVMLIPHRVRVILKKVIFRIPVLGTAMRYVGFVPVDRRGIKAGKTSVKRAARLMRELGYSFLVFPEGTRSRDGNLGKFKRGGFFLALESGAPIVPIAIKGTFELMPKGSFFPRRGDIRVTFRRPIPVRGYDVERLPELMEKVRMSILADAREGET